MLHPHHKVLSGVGGWEGGMSQPLKDTQEATIKQTGTAMVNNEQDLGWFYYKTSI